MAGALRGPCPATWTGRGGASRRRPTPAQPQPITLSALGPLFPGRTAATVSDPYTAAAACAPALQAQEVHAAVRDWLAKNVSPEVSPAQPAQSPLSSLASLGTLPLSLPCLCSHMQGAPGGGPGGSAGASQREGAASAGRSGGAPLPACTGMHLQPAGKAGPRVRANRVQKSYKDALS